MSHGQVPIELTPTVGLRVAVHVEDGVHLVDGGDDDLYHVTHLGLHALGGQVAELALYRHLQDKIHTLLSSSGRGHYDHCSIHLHSGRTGR